MSGGAKKAAPREKEVSFSEERYEVLETSYINGSLHYRGDEVHLPQGVKAGANLELIKDPDEKSSAKK